MMNDRYLFRGKRIDNGEWVIGYYHQAKYFKSDDDLIDFITIPHPDIKNADNDIFIVIPETVGQCTGLKDKNGRLIFEGDVIKTKKYGKETGHSNVNDFDIFKVVYEPAVFRLKAVHRAFNLVGNGDEYEVIGNIHDNPELLEER